MARRCVWKVNAPVPRRSEGDRICDEPALQVQRPLTVSTGTEEPAHVAPPARADEAGPYSVYDEPAWQAAMQDVPEHARTYANWYRDGLARMPFWRSQAITLGLALLAGPFAVAGALFFAQPATTVGLVATVIMAPVIEEILKIGVALLAFERRPYWFTSGAQLFVLVLVSALCFATVENLLYLNVYIQQPSDTIILWRWTVCTALHLGATGLAGLGLLRVFQVSRATLSPPDASLGAPMFAAAIALHAAYNGTAYFAGFWLG